MGSMGPQHLAGQCVRIYGGEYTRVFKKMLDSPSICKSNFRWVGGLQIRTVNPGKAIANADGSRPRGVMGQLIMTFPKAGHSP